MKRLLLAILLLAGCQEETQSLAPVALTEEAVGHYCQMNLLEHPGPKAQVHLDGMEGMPLFFSQVRDAVTYLRLPEQDGVILAVYVNDMGADGASWETPGATNWIAAESAHYVVGSAMDGGMGAPELVPFAAPAKARAFALAHGGTVLSLAEIPDTALLSPEASQSDAPAEDDADYQTRLRALTQRPGAKP